MLTAICQILGALLLVHILYRIVAFVHLYFVRRSTLDRYLREDGKAYALVTGASDGIGLALSETLLDRGFNVVLHSRSDEKLERITKELRSRHPDRDILYVAADASDPKTAIPKIAGFMGKLEGRGGKLTVLVNNLGGAAFFNNGRTFAYFKDTPFDSVNASLNLNAIFPVQLTWMLLPSMLAQGGHGLVINLGSYAGHVPVPLTAPYSISKALLHHFSRILALEFNLTQTPIEVLGILIAQVKTPGQGGDTTSFTVLSPREAAQSILDRVGCGYDVVTGSWRHCVAVEGLKWLPPWVGRTAVVGQTMKMAELERVKMEKAK